MDADVNTVCRNVFLLRWWWYLQNVRYDVYRLLVLLSLGLCLICMHSSVWIGIGVGGDEV